jgi:phosphoribosyl 1,2-cyclic phosphodiesterase/FixJ family two-component response regulator
MRIRFWGTRGSLAKPGPTTVRYGGNTACVEVQAVDGTRIVLDCGTGAHGLGQALLATGERPIRGHLLITHTHWDHIQGVPFFAPLFDAGNEWDIYAPRGLGQSLRDTLSGQMQYTYFPVTLEQLGATIRYHDIVEGVFQAGGVRVATRYVNHPALTLAYRLEADGVVVVYVTDHEPYSRPAACGAGADGIEGEDRRHADFLSGADLVIHDAQYTVSEYPARAGWGHSTVDYAVDVALAAGARQVALFHHDPLRDDEAIDRLVVLARARAAGGLQVRAAAEGLVIDLEADRARSRPSPSGERSAVAEVPQLALQSSVLVAVSDPATVVALSDAVRADGLRLFLAADADSALHTVEAERPSLLILERDLPGRPALELCRAIRAGTDAYDREVPVVIVAEHGEPDASTPGVTDWLLKPFTIVYARTRIRRWLLRVACRWVPAPVPDDERERLQALSRLGVLDTDPEERFDRITRLASAVLGVPIALVSLVDTDRQWFKSSHGLDTRQTPRDVAFCAHAILGDDVFVVPDALLDPRFADNPLTTGEPRVRFYAGCPLSVGGHRVGTLCLIDHRPRQLDEAQLHLLRDLADLVRQELAGPTAA